MHTLPLSLGIADTSIDMCLSAVYHKINSRNESVFMTYRFCFFIAEREWIKITKAWFYHSRSFFISQKAEGSK